MDGIPPEAVVAGPQRSPQDLLALALCRLDEALAQQRAAVAEWRDSLRTLAGVVGRVEGNLDAYREGLADLALGTDRLGVEMRALEATCGRAGGGQA
jgi:hypothetical protein